MAKSEHIPLPAVRRLSLYLRQLETIHGGDRRTVSSKQLGEMLGISDAQIRKDLAYFGQFGHPGIGYRVPELIQRVRRILGTDRKSNVLLVGAGNLGRALISYRGFGKKGFEVVAVFDADPAKIGTMIPGPRPISIQPIDEISETVKRSSIRTSILAVPADAAQSVADEIIAAGVRAILNFAPITLRVSDDVAVSSVDLAVHLEQLSFHMGARPEAD